MTQEEKELLLKDLCARLPYGVKCYCKLYDKDSDGYPLDTKHDGIGVLCTIYTHEGDSYPIEFVEGIVRYSIEEVKPFFRPMSSMTEEEICEFIQICDTVLWVGDKRSACILSLEQTDWLNAHHFDYRDLIGKDLALEAPEGMYSN